MTAPCVLPKLYMIPAFWKADGYGRLVDYLKAHFTLTAATDNQAGNILEFPYDWRLSNQLNAQRLSNTVVPALDRWRQATKNPNAKLIFICHSMGGLVARYFLEVRKGRELTSKLITIGTPYQGSVNALDALVNGLFLGLGPIGFSVDKLVRSFPSAHQLLPTYDCLDFGNGELCNLAGCDLPNVVKNDVAEASAFHSRIAGSLERNPKYETFAIKGIDQPTSQSALLRNGKIEPLRTYNKEDKSGDGTVPRPSSKAWISLPSWKPERLFQSMSYRRMETRRSRCMFSATGKIASPEAIRS